MDIHGHSCTIIQGHSCTVMFAFLYGDSCMVICNSWSSMVILLWPVFHDFSCTVILASTSLSSPVWSFLYCQVLYGNSCMVFPVWSLWLLCRASVVLAGKLK